MGRMLRQARSEVLEALEPFLFDNFRIRLDARHESILDTLAERLNALFNDRSAWRDFFSVARAVSNSVDTSLNEVAGVRVVPDTRTMNDYVERNVSLVRTITQEQLGDLKTQISKALGQGLHIDDARKLIQDRFDVSERRAKFWARDQTLKLHARITEERYQAAGFQTYIWTTSGDEAVRSDHSSLDGTVQRWDNPPVTDERTGARNHPGQDYNCRCVATVNPAEADA